MNGLFLENEKEVLKIVEKAVANYECLDHRENRAEEIYKANKKCYLAVQTVIDLNKEFQQNTEVTLENLEQEHSKGIHTNKF